MLIVDRIEGAFAVCERLDGCIVNIPLNAVCPPVAEGDVLCFAEQGLFCRSKSETEKRQAKAKALLEGLFS